MILEKQEDQTGLLREIYRLGQMKLEGRIECPGGERPVWLVPISRNPDFVGRESTIRELERRLDCNSDFMQTTVLFGLGGVG